MKPVYVPSGGEIPCFLSHHLRMCRSGYP